MSKFLSQYEQNEKLKAVAENYRNKYWASVLRFLLAEAGVPLCKHDYWEPSAHTDCPECSAELDRAMQEGL